MPKNWFNLMSENSKTKFKNKSIFICKKKKKILLLLENSILSCIHSPDDHNLCFVLNSSSTWARSGLRRSIVVCIVNAVLTLRVLALCLGFTMKPNAKLAGTGGRYNHVKFGSPQPHGQNVHF